MKQITITKNKTLEIKKPVSNMSVLVEADVKANLVLKNVVKNINVKVGSKAKFHLVNLVNGVVKSECKVIIKLAGLGAKVQVSGLFHGQASDKHEFEVVLHHQAAKTKGDILIMGVYEDKARGFFSGLIKIDPKAQGTDSFFTNNNLLLDEASVVSIPRLEIGTNKVKASHGSTTSRVNEEQLYYLMSRGLPEKIARCMIVEGFLQPVIRRLKKIII